MLEEDIYKLAENKKNLFIEYEKESCKLLDCDIDDIEKIISIRNEIADKINDTELKITELCKSDSSGMLVKVLKNSCNRGDVSGILSDIFDCSQQTFAAIYRISMINNDAEERIKSEKENIMDEIKKMNNGQSAKASRYVDSVDIGDTPHFSQNIKSI